MSVQHHKSRWKSATSDGLQYQYRNFTIHGGCGRFYSCNHAVGRHESNRTVELGGAVTKYAKQCCTYEGCSGLYLPIRFNALQRLSHQSSQWLVCNVLCSQLQWFLDKNGPQRILVALAFQIPTVWVTPEPLPMERATLSHLQRSSLPAAQETALTFQEAEIWRSGQAEIGGGVLTIGGPRLVTVVREHREIIGTCDHRPG